MQDRFKTFTLLMANINRSIRRIKTEEMAEFDLKSQHVACLYYLYRSGSLTARELCHMCEEDKANISRALDYLEENGYIVTERASHRYKRALSLTQKGEAVARRLSDRVNAVLQEAGIGVPEEERTVMYRCLDMINANLQRICDQYEN